MPGSAPRPPPHAPPAARPPPRAPAARPVGCLLGLQAADGRGQDAHGTSKEVYDWSLDLEDEQSDCELPLLKIQGRAGKSSPIPVDKMYSSRPSSTSLSAKRTHTIDAEVSESDHEKCLKVESSLPRRFSKRRKEQLRNPSFVHSRKHTPVPLPPSSTEISAEDSESWEKQKNRCASPDDGFHERYLKLKREEIDRFAAIEEKKLEDPYSIKKCITVLEGLNGLQMGDILVAADIFKTKENREIFLSFSSDALRLAWITREIGRVN